MAVLKTTKISGTSRSAIKIKDNFYTVEASMEKSVEDDADMDVQEEYRKLFDELNDVVDNQCKDIIDTFK